MNRRYDFPRRPDGAPLCIAHRGASAAATENTLAAFRAASELGAEMWEIDIRLTADGLPVVSHDAALMRCFGVEGIIADLTGAELASRCPEVPDFAATVALAEEMGAALYIEIKDRGAGPAVLTELERSGFARAAIGSFMAEEVRDIAEAGSRWPLSVLVRLGEDPFAQAALSGAGTIHLCWEKGGARPQDLVTPELLARARAEGLGVVLWHEERPQILADLMAMPVLGICTNQPELMRGFDFLPSAIEVVCHRGANRFAPENTLAAARLAFDQGAAFVELDVQTSADGALVVIHDHELGRTANGSGPVAAQTLAGLRALDAGGWFSRHYAGEKIPLLDEMIDLAQSYGRRLYIENKAVDPARLVQHVAARGFLEHCFFWSFSAEARQAMLAAHPGAQVKGNWRRAEGRAEPAGADGSGTFALTEIHVEHYAQQAPLALAAGLLPMMQYFGEDPAVFDQIVRLAPPRINLNRADLLLAAIARARAETRQGAAPGDG